MERTKELSFVLIMDAQPKKSHALFVTNKHWPIRGAYTEVVKNALFVKMSFMAHVEALRDLTPHRKRNLGSIITLKEGYNSKCQNIKQNT